MIALTISFSLGTPESSLPLHSHSNPHAHRMFSPFAGISLNSNSTLSMLRHQPAQDAMGQCLIIPNSNLCLYSKPQRLCTQPGKLLSRKVHFSFFFPPKYPLSWLRQYRIHLHCRRPGFDPWGRKILWRKAWQPTPVFLPGLTHGQRSLVGYSPRGHKELDMTDFHFHFSLSNSVGLLSGKLITPTVFLFQGYVLFCSEDVVEREETLPRTSLSQHKQ